MTNRLAAFILLVLLAAGVSAQHAATAAPPNITGTWNMGLQGDHVIPTALMLKQDGTKVTGTIMLPTSRIGERKEVALEGTFADGALALSGTVEGGAEPVAIDIAGKLNDDGSMEGTMQATHGRMTWTAERLKERQ